MFTNVNRLHSCVLRKIAEICNYDIKLNKAALVVYLGDSCVHLGWMSVGTVTYHTKSYESVASSATVACGEPFSKGASDLGYRR